ncbi:MAG: methyltransferase [Ilumatobacter coccineus]|uniref:Methylated-DNA--protein-cysteine methyltransferase n=1 Tax=Ilumatobacter coccineus TaxID=467094 RepID=A0A2G6KCY5_9ACTN|nr:MAG: methyltransferase [Ilumatobacter coccineus]
MYRRVMTSPIGPIEVVTSDGAVVAVHLGDHEDSDDGAEAEPGACSVLDRAITQLDEYFAGQRREFDLPLAMEGTEFQRSAWQVLTTIAYGETITYGEQATRLGNPQASRAVGTANGANPIPIIVPCHRVVGSDGHLTGYASGVEIKAWLIDHERSVVAAS